MPPTDPTPYATIAKRLAERRAANPSPSLPGSRSRHALRAFLDSQAASPASIVARNRRMRESLDDINTFDATIQRNGDYS